MLGFLSLIMKDSAARALGNEIINMVKKFSEKRSLKFFLLKGSDSIFFIKY